MKITDVRPILLTHPYGTEPDGRRSACLVEVETDAGITGIGETHAGVYVPEVAASIVELFKPLVVGLDPTGPEAVYRTAYRATSYFGRTGLTVMVLSGIENALWDIVGQVRGNALESELFVEPLVIRDGYVQPPTAPGLGIRLPQEVRDKYRFVPGSGSTFGV